jgi:hypothetical protein
VHAQTSDAAVRGAAGGAEVASRAGDAIPRALADVASGIPGEIER